MYLCKSSFCEWFNVIGHLRSCCMSYPNTYVVSYRSCDINFTTVVALRARLLFSKDVCRSSLVVFWKDNVLTRSILHTEFARQKCAGAATLPILHS
jgi:hypothetical protein